MAGTAKKKGRPLRIAVDFDGTIVTHAFPYVGEPRPGAIEALRLLQEAGHQLILWTCREDPTDQHRHEPFLSEAVGFLTQHGIRLRSVNTNHPDDEFRPGGGRKVYADIYIDDRNFGGFPGWDVIVRGLLGVELPL